ncbi:MAG: SH3 domain-containing protein [Anaerolineaceae bacterium]|nr:SH3 domain-containing protein [Anaerolineaceae bacterium]
MKKVRQRFLLTVLSVSLILMAGAVFVPSVQGSSTRQTIPTRTPVPPPPTATQSGGGGSNPTATHTPPGAAATPTSTLLPVNIAPTPVGGFLPTAVPCSGNPTIQTRGATNVRSGPGLEYDVIGELVYLEVRYIVGRAQTAEWWLIQFNNGQFGWVSNDIVLVQGYTPIVPIVEAPPLNGSTPTPGPLWNPTPFPSCTVTPVPSDTPTAAAEIAQAEEDPTETPSPTQIPPTEVRPTDTPIVQPTAVPVNPTAPAATAVPTVPTEENRGSSLIFVGLAVVAGVGLGVFFLRRR